MGYAIAETEHECEWEEGCANLVRESRIQRDGQKRRKMTKWGKEVGYEGMPKANDAILLPGWSRRGCQHSVKLEVIMVALTPCLPYKVLC